MLQRLLDYLFPRRSLTGELGQWITEEERGKLASFPVIEGREDLKKRGIKFIDNIRAGSTYCGCPLLKKAVHTFKYRGVRSIAEDLGTLLVAVAPPTQNVVLCPVPLHWTRAFARGFNQADLLACVVARDCGLPLERLLKRTRPTGHQVRRTKDERLAGVCGAFRCTVDRPPVHVVLIDDLSTTGATLSACAKALKDAGVERVDGWVVAHG